MGERIIAAFAPLNPERVLLFGSWARGAADAESDVDVVVVYPTHKRFLDRLEELYLLWPLPVAVDILAYTPDEFQEMLQWNAFLQDIVAESKILYERPRS
ncbi:MAG: nucleotidyltransferase domain-containing protein [Deferrisomatales bacterium]